MSIERSRNDSSREDTVSHVRQRVSLVSTPSKSLCTIVAWCAATCAVVVDEGGCVESVAMDALTSQGAALELRDTGVRKTGYSRSSPDLPAPFVLSLSFLPSASISSMILFSRKLRNSWAS